MNSTFTPPLPSFYLAHANTFKLSEFAKESSERSIDHDLVLAKLATTSSELAASIAVQTALAMSLASFHSFSC